MKKSVLLPYDKYIALKQSIDRQCNVDDIAVNQTSSENNISVETPNRNREKLLLLLPPANRSRAERLLNFVEQSNSVDWNSNGNIVINKEPIHNTHICDIIHYITSQKKKPPPGASLFIKNLPNLPQSLISNANFSGGSSIPPGIPTKKRSLNSKTQWQTL